MACVRILVLALALGCGAGVAADAQPPGAPMATAAESAAGLDGLLHSLRAAWGHLQVLARSRSVDALLQDPDTAPALAERLRLSQAIRRFAVEALALPDGPSYTRYADLGREAVLWNVVAAPPLSLELRRWCFPVAGCVAYRGYFDEAAASELEGALRQQGWEVLRYPVRAYSTLGRTNLLGGDPLLNTFALGSPIELARLLFHELAHQKVYAPGDTAFNEAYATAVEQLGLAQWAQHASAASVTPAQWARWAEGRERGRAWAELLQQHRAELERVYAGVGDASDKLQAKAEARSAFERRYAALRDGAWGGDRRWDAAVAALNNAQLAIHGSYHAGVPAFLRLFEQVDRDFGRFHAEVQRLASEPDERRQAWLRGVDTP